MKGLKENLGAGTLKMYGQQAASNYIKGGHDSLTGSVCGILKQANANPTEQQIARVCEAANHAMWHHVFSGQDKTAGFRPADTEAVVQSVYTAGDLPTRMRTRSKYASAKSMFSLSPDDVSEEHRWLFEESKTASSDNTYEVLDRMGVSFDTLHDQMYKEASSWMDKAVREFESAVLMHKTAAYKFMSAAREAVVQRTPFEDIAAVVKSVGGPAEWQKSACVDLVGAHLYGLNLIRRKPTAEWFDSFSSTKVANPNGDLYKTYKEMVDSASDGYAIGMTIKEASESLVDELNATMMNKTAEGLVGSAIGLGGKALGKGVSALGRGVSGVGEAFGRAAASHPFLTAGGLTTGYFFGPDIASMATSKATDIAEDLVGGVIRPLSDFPSEDGYTGYSNM